MILGLSIADFTVLHVAISLVGIAAGFVALPGLVRGQITKGWTAVFLATTVATSVTGFFFPLKAIGPPHIVGVISLGVLAAALLALYGKKRVGVWGPVYAVTAILALYLNVFVGVTQAFLKLPPLHALAPAGTEPPFLVAQGLTLLAFVALGYRAMKAGRTGA